MACLRQKAQIDYPCNWSYKIIGASKEHLEIAVEGICGNKDFDLKHSNNSKGGKYISMNLSLLVMNEEERVEIFRQLENHESVKMVL